MKSVLAETNEFATVTDILNRFETLTAARKKLTEQQTRDLATLENTHNSVVRLREVRQNVVQTVCCVFAVAQDIMKTWKSKGFDFVYQNMHSAVYLPLQNWHSIEIFNFSSGTTSILSG
jgi:hypothetical protein